MFGCLILSMLFLTTGVNAVRINSSDYKIYRDKMLVHREQGVPHEMNYQGWLGTADDTTGVTGTFTMIFRLYTRERGGTAVWSETHSNVNVSNGIFNVILGSVNPIPAEIFTGVPLWLEVQVGDEVLAPRKKLVSVGYAIQAENAEHARYADTAKFALGADVKHVDSADVAANAWRWSGNMWGVEYPKANVADTANYVAGTNVAGEVSEANYADTAGYALSVDINYVDSAGVAANAWRWNNHAWGEKYPEAEHADTATYADTADYARVGGPDNDWVLETSPANYLRTYGDYGIARKGAVLYGSNAYTHVNLGVACTTGAAGSDWGYCTVNGGLYNTASNDAATVSGGYDNTASGYAATVGGGENNTASGDHATVGGGYHNIVSGKYATVGGGSDNTASGYTGAIGGGSDNTANGYIATVGGGYGNTASGYYATVGGGRRNIASGSKATVGGGHNNIASGDYATVGGGYFDTASGYGATVSGGWSNTASGLYAAVIGGYENTAAGSYSIAGGYLSSVPSDYSNSVAFNGQTATASSQLRCGTISKTGGGFTIDHPLDPDNKILNHYFVESPEMVLIYRGVAVIGADGRATVHLPEYFDALNRNPMIHLTGVGTSDVYVVEEIHNNQFVIGGKPGTKVYWMVTGERKDQSAEIIRALMPVEQQKTGALVGRSLDDEFLATTMMQLEEMGISHKFHFRTAAGRRRYELMKQPPQKPVEEIREPPHR